MQVCTYEFSSLARKRSPGTDLCKGAFGEGLSENVCEAYNFLVNNFEKGDELYIFGFSRGAYTARAYVNSQSSIVFCC